MRKIEVGNIVKVCDYSYSRMINEKGELTSDRFHKRASTYKVVAVDCALPSYDGYSKINDTVVYGVGTGVVMFIREKYLSIIPTYCECCG